MPKVFKVDINVSTHSRPKAAGACRVPDARLSLCFNTQPPEGGWSSVKCRLSRGFCFNTQPPEGGWIMTSCTQCVLNGFNTQPPEGGWVAAEPPPDERPPVSTHSRPKAAGPLPERVGAIIPSFNTQPPEGGWLPKPLKHLLPLKFQHTAA